MKSLTKCPLTQSQLQIWAGQKLNPNTPLHNTTHSFRIAGQIRPEIFAIAFEKLIAEVDAFRIVFDEDNGIPNQSVLSILEHKIDFFDFSNTSEDIDLWLQKRSQKKLDLTKKSFDCALLKIEASKFVWYLNMHHLITDAVSATLVFKYLSSLYAHFDGKSTYSFGNVPSYKTYIAFEKEHLNLDDKEEIQAYWSDTLVDLKQAPALYGVRSNQKTTSSTRISLPLGATRSKKLKVFAQKEEFKSLTKDLSLFNVLSALFASYIFRISGQHKFAFGAPIHNRTSKTFKETVGLFIEIFPIVVEFKKGDTFASVLERIKLESNNFLRYAQPGMIRPEISGSFNIILNYISANFSDFAGYKVKSTWLHPGHIDVSHQLRCHIIDFDATGEIEILFDVNHSVFDTHLTNTITTHFLNLFDAFIEDSTTLIEKPSLISKPIGINNNSTEISPKDLIISKFEACAQQHSTKIALQQKQTHFNFGEIDKKANQLGQFLQQKGVKKGQPVAVHLFRSSDYIISVLAILKIGAVFVPIASDQPSERVKYILSDSKCDLIITETALISKFNNGLGSVVLIDALKEHLATIQNELKRSIINFKDTAYILYTSGSTGKPKGVLISHGALANYLSWAASYYRTDQDFIFPLFTSIGFDLTITATFLPLITGGKLIVYKESDTGPDISLMEVLEENKVNSIKLTPSHLALVKDSSNSASQIKTMIVGGETFKTETAKAIQRNFGLGLRIFNEYGPTEATVGCIVSQYKSELHLNSTVPVGMPITGMNAYILDDFKNPVPKGVIGTVYISGNGLSDGYLNLPKLTAEKFISIPELSSGTLYHTGDLARINKNNEFEFLGRKDEQVKLKGFRIELEDIESNLLKHNAIENAAVVVLENEKAIPEHEVINCTLCGLPSNYPNTDFDEDGVCHVCNAFKGYKDQAQRYFKTEDELRKILLSKRGKSPTYDCISLLSGGKDSTYILAQLVNMGLRVLAFTLDNGYISDQAKGNINRIVSKLNVDHMYGTTEHMNKIFVDSLHRHQNVCNGCFKTIYTLSTKIALEKEIPFVVTGLSRGQFFETRLTEELFWDKDIDVSTIDKTILEARKLYHQEEDAVKEFLNTTAFDNDDTFNKVQFVDFYRYSDVSLSEMLRYLKEKVDWIRPTDTGRSTNCTINQLGIYVHKKEKGYSNYSYPYSWDVRMSHKTRTETLEEINEVIDENEVKRIMTEIGYTENSESEQEQQKLVGYYTSNKKLSSKELANHLKDKLPEYMIPHYFKYVEELPLTKNGKVDKESLRSLNTSQLDMDTPFIAPSGEIEELLAEIWKEVLRLKQVGIHDNFIGLGGHSLAAIRVTARINEEIEMKFPLNKIFELPTIAEYAKYIEETLTALLQE